MKYIPLSNWTMDEEGSNRVEVVSTDDKHQITATFAASLSGHFHLWSWYMRGDCILSSYIDELKLAVTTG